MGKTERTKSACPGCGDGMQDGERKSHHDEKTIRDLVNRMNRIEGQVRGIRGMIEKRVYCDDVLNQISSAQSALHGVSQLLLRKAYEVLRSGAAAGRRRARGG